MVCVPSYAHSLPVTDITNQSLFSFLLNPGPISETSAQRSRHPLLAEGSLHVRETPPNPLEHHVLRTSVKINILVGIGKKWQHHVSSWCAFLRKKNPYTRVISGSHQTTYSASDICVFHSKGRTERGEEVHIY